MSKDDAPGFFDPPPRKTYEELKAKYGDTFGLKPNRPPASAPRPAPTDAELRAHYRNYSIGWKPKPKKQQKAAEDGKDEPEVRPPDR